MREQRAFLHHITDATALRRHVQAGCGDHLATDRDAAAIRPLEARDQAQQGRLAAARGAEDGDEAAGGDIEIHPLKDGDIAKRFARFRSAV